MSAQVQLVVDFERGEATLRVLGLRHDLHPVESVGDSFSWSEASRARGALVDRGEVPPVVELFCPVYVGHAVHELHHANFVETRGSCLDPNRLSADVAVLVVEHRGHVR